DRCFLEAGAGPYRDTDERRVAPVALGILEPLDTRPLHVLRAVPLQWRLLETRQPQPAVLAPDLEVRMIALVEIVAGRHCAEGAVVEAQGDRGGVLDIKRLPADNAREPRHLLHLQSGDVQRQVEPVNAEPDQVSTAAPRLAAVPLLAVGRVLEARLVGDEIGFHRVDLAEFAVANESAGPPYPPPP